MALKTPVAVPPYDPSRADMRLPQAAFKFRADNPVDGAAANTIAAQNLVRIQPRRRISSASPVPRKRWRRSSSHSSAKQTECRRHSPESGYSHPPEANSPAS